uniref:Uncharacterized protein n=1 Tax=Fagus sylvatica TaxID=28930 RepID=A0A2N9IH98_FAGSY
MSVERSFRAWEEVQRPVRTWPTASSQGPTGLIQSHITPPSFPWPNPHNSKLFDLEFPSQSFGTRDFGLVTHDSSGINGEPAHACPCRFGTRITWVLGPRQYGSMRKGVVGFGRSDLGVATTQGDLELLLTERLRDLGFL